MSAHAHVMAGQPNMHPMARADHNAVHAAHCCARHWCKYGSDNCPVLKGEIAQRYACEACQDEIEDEWPLIVAANEAYEAGRRRGQTEGYQVGTSEIGDGGTLAEVPVEVVSHPDQDLLTELLRVAREWAATPLSRSSSVTKDRLAAAVKACAGIETPTKVVKVSRRGRS